MNVYAANFTMTGAEILEVTEKAANYTCDPYGSPVYHLRCLLGV